MARSGVLRALAAAAVVAVAAGAASAAEAATLVTFNETATFFGFLGAASALVFSCARPRRRPAPE